jgi:hypothetical protein
MTTLIFIGLAWVGLLAFGFCIFASNIAARRNEE